jgi:hypothetical protein
MTLKLNNRRRRRQQRNNADAYVDDDIIRDGEVVRIPMMLADAAPMQPWPRPTPPQLRYGRGYVADAGTGAIVDRRPAPHGTGFAHHVQTPPARDAAASTYYAMKDALSTEYLRHGPKRDACCSGCASHDATISPPHSGELLNSNDPYNPQPKRQYPLGGYTPDPNASGMTAWPDPFALSSQHEGDACTLNGAPGTLRRGQNGDMVCVPTRRGDAGQDVPITAMTRRNGCTMPDGRAGHMERGPGGVLTCVPGEAGDQAPSNIGPPEAPVGMEWAQGAECDLGGGEVGRYVKQGDRLICRSCDDDYDDAASVSQARRDRAYFDSVRDMQQAWRSW